MSKQFWVEKKKTKKTETKKVCQKCLKLFEDVDMYIYSVDSEIPHGALCCSDCAKELPQDILIPFSNRKVKQKIDTKGWIEGEPTKKGNVRYIFIDEKGKEVTLLAETGVKKGLKPKK
jgi:hypothetical protein